MFFTVLAGEPEICRISLAGAALTLECYESPCTARRIQPNVAIRRNHPEHYRKRCWELLFFSAVLADKPKFCRIHLKKRHGSRSQVLQVCVRHLIN